MKGIGTDIVQIARITKVYEAQSDRFVHRILTSKEQEVFMLRKKSMTFLANRFAGKEALAKALGTGIAKGINFVDFEILPDDLGSPVVTLYGEAKVRLTAIGGVDVKISLSDEKDYAVAFAVIL